MLADGHRQTDKGQAHLFQQQPQEKPDRPGDKPFNLSSHLSVFATHEQIYNPGYD